MFLRNVCKRCGVLFLLGFFCTLSLRADLKYEQATQVSGAMVDMLKKMPFVGKKMNLDNSSVHYFTSNSMRSDTTMGGKLTKSEIILLNQEQFINIDHEKKTFTVLTFAQMREQWEKAMQQMKESKKDRQEKPEATVTPKISVKDAGESKVINGYNCHHMILNLSMEIQDQKSGQKGSMDMVSDLWVTKDVQGFEEQREFYRRFAEKMGAMTYAREMMGMMGGMMQDPNASQGMTEMKKELAKMEGTPILTITSMMMPAGSMPPESAQSQSKNEPPPDVGKEAKQSAEDSVVDQATEKVGKILGGFGGFGRKKKKPEPTPEKPPATAPASPNTSDSGQPASAGNPQPFMKTTSEMKNFERGGLSSALFTAPAGYKQVDGKN
jgi:hypothetical protein